MAEEKKARVYQLTPRAALVSTGVEVERLQRYVAQYGYFDSGEHAKFGMTRVGAEPLPRKCDDRTQRKLRKFQTFQRLPMTGTLDQDTVER